MSGFGRNVQETSGRPIAVSADGRPEWKIGGVTLDWSTVSAVSSTPATLDDGTVVAVGDKYLRYGTVLVPITQREVVEVDIDDGATPTGGTFTLTFGGATTSALAHNASAADVEAALEALASIGAGNISVALASMVYTLTFQGVFDGVNVGAVTASAASLTTGGGAATIGITVTFQGTTSFGLYGEHLTNATDGRQTMTRGKAFILNETVVASEPNSDHPAVIEGGAVFVDRLVCGGTHQPTLANILTAFPRLRPVYETA